MKGRGGEAVKRFFEWQASRTRPRFRAYRAARLDHEAYLARIRTPYDRLAAEDHRQAAADERLRAAEAGYREAIRLSEREGAARDAGVAQAQLGMLLHLQGRLAAAQEAFAAALDTLSGLVRPDDAARAVVSTAHYHLGLLAHRAGRRDEARRQLQRSLAMDSSLGDARGMTVTRAALERLGLPEAEDAPRRERTASAKDDDASGGGLGDALGAGLGDALGAGLGGALGDGLGDALGRALRHGSGGSAGSAGPLGPAGASGASDLMQLHPGAGAAQDVEVVWLLSESVAVNDLVLAALQAHAGPLPRQVTVTRAAFGSADPALASLEAERIEGRLSAAILALEPGALDNPRMRHWTQWCIREVAARWDFRLFVHFHGMAADQLQRLAAEGDELLALLLDTIQIPEDTSPAVLSREVGQYLRRLGDVRALAAGRALRKRAAIALGRLAKAAQAAAGAAAAAGWLFALARSRAEQPLDFFGLDPSAIAVVAGLVWFPMISIPLFLLFRGPGAGNALLRENPRLGAWLVVSFFLATAAVGVPQRAGASWAWIALGLTLSVVVDVARRTGRRLERADLSLSRAFGLADAPAPAPMFAQLARGKPLHPLTCPILPAASPQVFISYTRASPWSRAVAGDLHRQLSAAGCLSFLDKEGIGQGSDWRRQLNESIADANVFVCVLDRRALRQKWVAAELITALAGQRLTGLPDVIVLTDPEMQAPGRAAALPVFQHLLALEEEAAGDGRPRVVAATPGALLALRQSLRPRTYRTAAILPPFLAHLLLLPTVPAAALGVFATLLGPLALLLGVLDSWQRIDAGAWLASLGLRAPATILCGYLAGFGARLALASFLEVRHEHPRALGTLHLAAAGGFVLLGARIGGAAGPLAVGWAGAMAALGWLIAGTFIARAAARRGAPEPSG